jgi:hypothetical protein
LGVFEKKSSPLRQLLVAMNNRDQSEKFGWDGAPESPDRRVARKLDLDGLPAYGREASAASFLMEFHSAQQS